MSNMPDVRLQAVSVVITANYYNPSILNNDFLANNKIVDSNWKITETVSTPAVSIIKYDNGISWFVDQQRLEISKEYDVLLEDHADSDIHRLAVEYVKILPYVPYQHIGLNCVVSFKNEDSLQWMTKKFLKTGLYKNDVVMVPRFVIKTDKGMLSFSFDDGTAQHDGKPTKSLIIQCNYHFAGPFQSNMEMIDILSGWKDIKNAIASRLSEVLR